MKPQILLAKGHSLEELEKDMQRIANIREKEIQDILDEGCEGEDWPENHFNIAGAISFVEGVYVCPMMRTWRPG